MFSKKKKYSYWDISDNFYANTDIAQCYANIRPIISIGQDISQALIRSNHIFTIYKFTACYF